jgi:peroxiredoxin
MKIQSITLKTPAGDDYSLDQLSGKPVAVQLVRYFGCLPCQQYLQEFSAARERFESLGYKTLCVGGSADYQARWLADNGVAIDLLLDPEHAFRHAVGLGDIGAHNLLRPKGAINYLRAFGEGRKPMAITRDTLRSPGVALLDENLEVVWTYEGKALGDYPPLDEFEAAAQRLANRARF